MPCYPPMNQTEIIASISIKFTKINALSLVTSMNNIYLYHVFSNFCIICSYNRNERLEMFLPNIISWSTLGHENDP